MTTYIYAQGHINSRGSIIRVYIYAQTAISLLAESASPSVLAPINRVIGYEYAKTMLSHQKSLTIPIIGCVTLCIAYTGLEGNSRKHTAKYMY